MMDPTLDVVDRLIQSYEPYIEEWNAIRMRDEFDPDLPYTHLGNLAIFLVERAGVGAFDGFDLLFDEFERLLDEAGMRNLLIVGFLEDLQNVSLNRGLVLDTWTR